ncbi:YgiQ family radical SAM protein, partial [Bacteroidales bacterium OttesenSCG-928-B11]|nr:YgiQ family radical SAM protein [Bacteroidales bacterium OttesenSCG-928-B11]
EEVKDLSNRAYFKGHISDLGGPSANMYKMRGRDQRACVKCKKPSCLHPTICNNLDINHKPLTSLYRKVRDLKNVKRITIGSGIRYEMLVTQRKENDRQNGLTEYTEEVIRYHVSGRLKIAPEHTMDHVVYKMRKPSFQLFSSFHRQFIAINKRLDKNQQLIPYFMSAHPGCRLDDMRELRKEAHKLRLITDQVQEFTPTPMTYSTAIYYLGFDPYTGDKVFVEKDMRKRKEQHSYFF